MRKQQKKVRGRGESQKSEEEGGRLHFAFLPEHSDAHLIQMPFLSEHHSPTKAMCEVKLFIHLHKKHLFHQINGFCFVYVQACVCVRGCLCFRKWRK